MRYLYSTLLYFLIFVSCGYWRPSDSETVSVTETHHQDQPRSDGRIGRYCYDRRNRNQKCFRSLELCMESEFEDYYSAHDRSTEPCRLKYILREELPYAERY